MVDISNKALALVLVAAIVVSLGGTMVSMNRLGNVGATGYATAADTGQANLTIEGDLSVRFVPAASIIQFGTGYAQSPGPCELVANVTGEGHNASGYCVNFVNTAQPPLTIENIGNTDATLNVSSDVDAAGLLGGSSPVFQWKFSNYEASSCAGALADTTWTSVSTAGKTICPSLGFNATDTKDTINLSVYLEVPNDANTGNALATFTATVSDI